MCGLQRRLLFFPPSPLAHYFLLSVEGNGWVAIKQDDATSYGRPAADSGNRPVETAHISFVIMFPLGERWLLHRPFPIFFYFKRALKKKRRKNKTAGWWKVFFFSSCGSARAFANKFRPPDLSDREMEGRAHKKTGQREDGGTKKCARRAQRRVLFR